jgi:hypothetical protein
MNPLYDLLQSEATLIVLGSSIAYVTWQLQRRRTRVDLCRFVHWSVSADMRELNIFIDGLSNSRISSGLNLSNRQASGAIEGASARGLPLKHIPFTLDYVRRCQSLEASFEAIFARQTQHFWKSAEEVGLEIAENNGQELAVLRGLAMQVQRRRQEAQDELEALGFISGWTALDPLPPVRLEPGKDGSPGTIHH